MLWNRAQQRAIQILASKFGVEYRSYNRFFYSGCTHDLLEVIDKKLEILLSEKGEEFFYEINKDISWAVDNLTFSELSSIGYGIDYNLELRRISPMISEENYPVLHFCLVMLPKSKEEGLINENHGKGYHIHYVINTNKRQTRTNVIFTFNPSETLMSTNILYWEHHGAGAKSAPDKFGKRRRNAIYDTSCSFLNKVPKTEFRAPVSAANVLWPWE